MPSTRRYTKYLRRSCRNLGLLGSSATGIAHSAFGDAVGVAIRNCKLASELELVRVGGSFDGLECPRLVNIVENVGSTKLIPQVSWLED